MIGTNISFNMPQAVCTVYIFLSSLLIYKVSAQINFDPGCSFSNGQCIYNVKLGHENQCDTTSKPLTPLEGAGSGFQNCSCKDIDVINSNINSLWSSMNTLQSNFGVLAKLLNVTQEQLGLKERELAHLLLEKNNVTAQLVSHQYLLNRSQVELANTVATMNTELVRLRKELSDTSDQLIICKTNLNILNVPTAKPVLYGNVVAHYCNFENIHMCNYTLDTCTKMEEDCWYRGTGTQDAYSGPVEDHTYGAPNGHYMHIDPFRKGMSIIDPADSPSQPFRNARMTSPQYPPAKQYCVQFWYTLFGRNIGKLAVYAQVGNGDGYPVFQHFGPIDQKWHMAQISLDSEYTAKPFKLVFQGTTNSYYVVSGYTHEKLPRNSQGFIAFDDVYVYNTSCNDIAVCPAGAKKVVNNNQTSCYTFHIIPMTWYEAIDQCKTEGSNAHLVSVNSKQEQDFIVQTVQNDTAYLIAGVNGWYTSGSDERIEGNFVWTDTGYPEHLSYTNWHIGQPNNVANSQDCLLLQYSDVKYEWGDVDCNEKHPFICEMQVS